MVHKIVVVMISMCTLAVAKIKVETILKAYETNLKMERTDARARVVLTQQKAGEGVKEIDAMWYRRDRDNAFLVVLLAPESDKGVGYLRVDENFWMYRPNTRTFQHINRNENIGGSNVSGESFEIKKLTELYGGVKDKNGDDIITTEMLGRISVYKFPLQAKVRDVDYPRKTYYTRKDNLLLLKEENYSGSGTLMRTVYYLKYTKVNGRYIAIKQIYVDEFEKGNRTIVEISGITTSKLDDAIFTKAYLENLSK